ncbi:MAG: hypothetical protein GY937_02960 [bacterium]|nr:hypothetical protein [bacterium]
MMKRLAMAAAAMVMLCVAYAAIHLAMIDVGKDIVILHKMTADGTTSRTRLWIVDGAGHSWLHHGWPEAVWIQHLQVDPIVVMDRDGAEHRFLASPDPGSDPEVHRLLREKYGLADRLVRFWWGSDAETGFLTGETCKTVPIRLVRQ